MYGRPVATSVTWSHMGACCPRPPALSTPSPERQGLPRPVTGHPSGGDEARLVGGDGGRPQNSTPGSAGLASGRQILRVEGACQSCTRPPFPLARRKGMGRRPPARGLGAIGLWPASRPISCVRRMVDATSHAPAAPWGAAHIYLCVLGNPIETNWVRPPSSTTARWGANVGVLPRHRASHRTAMTHPDRWPFPIRPSHRHLYEARHSGFRT